MRAFPISNWTELDIWRYIERENIELPPIYYAHERDVFRRDGMWMAVGEFSAPAGAEAVERQTVRYRTIGDMTCTGAVESRAATLPEIIEEVAATRITERGATRADDRVSELHVERAAGWAQARQALIRADTAAVHVLMDVSTVLEGDGIGPLLDALDDPGTAAAGPGRRPPPRHRP